MDDVKSILPESLEKKSHISTTLVESPTTQKLKDLNLIVKLEQQQQVEVGCAVLRDMH